MIETPEFRALGVLRGTVAEYLVDEPHDVTEPFPTHAEAATRLLQRGGPGDDDPLGLHRTALSSVTIAGNRSASSS